MVEHFIFVLIQITEKLSFDYSLKNISLPDKTLKTYEFESRNHPAQIILLEEFEKDLCGIVTSIKYCNVNSNFQEKLKSDISKIKLSASRFILADKTRNETTRP